MNKGNSSNLLEIRNFSVKCNNQRIFTLERTSIWNCNRTAGQSRRGSITYPFIDWIEYSVTVL